MGNLQGKKILLGISGSIAAYKSASLTRQLIKAGAEVQVLMTQAATNFITPLTLSTLSQKPVFTDVRSEESWNNHVEMGLWADAMVIAPVTATTLGKLAHGICDSIVVAAYLSARCPVYFAPAMDLDMWRHPATRDNVRRLQSFGNHLLPVGYGELASGLVGEGRMAEPEDIVAYLERDFAEQNKLVGQNLLITAGPTYEPIDPVRYIGNRSSGKMGIAIAEEAARRGATVKLILGPARLGPVHPSIEVIKVETAQEMWEAALEYFPQVQVGILAAAVADYRPTEAASTKIKKKEDTIQLTLSKNPDIASTLGQQKRSDQLLIGFALETDNAEANAREKLKKKNFDFIVLNSLEDQGAGFNHDTNKISILHKDNKIKKFELKSKGAVAKDIINEMIELLKAPLVV